MIDLKGKWIGFYGYTNFSLGESPSVPFEATILPGTDEFVGQIVEDEKAGGIVDQIVIKGKLEGDEIEFIKYYKKKHLRDEYGVRHSLESDDPNVIYYKGQYDEDDDRFKGQWAIPYLRDNGDGTYEMESQSGIWEMWREIL